MKTLALTLLLLGLSAPLRAEVLDLPVSPGPVTDPALPAKGMSMTAVSQRYGAPSQRHGAVGGDTPQHPPITRWDYPGFVVVFENQHVVDTVRPDAPAPVARKDGLSP